MRRTMLVFILILAGCAATAAPQADPLDSGALAPVTVPEAAAPVMVVPTDLTELSVAEAVAVALDRNPDLGIAAARIAGAREEVLVARSTWYPRLDVSFGYANSNDPVNVFMGQLRQRDLKMTGDFNSPGWWGNSRLAADVSYAIYDGGRRQAYENLAGSKVLLEERQRDAVQNELKAAVIGMSLMVYESAEFTRVAGESVALVTQQLDIAGQRFDSGVVQRSDVLRVEVRLAEAREVLVRSRNGHERALAALRNLLGIESDVPFSLKTGGEFKVPPVLEEEYMDAARANRPELRRAEETIRAAEHAVALAEAGELPTVSAFGTYALDAQYVDFGFDQDSGMIGIRVDWAAFEGFRSRADIAVAKAQVRAAKERLRQVELGVEQDVTQARLTLSEARERTAVSLKSEELAGEALDLIRARYENGAATITEYLDAEVALTGARVRNVAAKYDEQRSTADLRRALGVCRASLSAPMGAGQ
jgi:outer membrane protein